MVFKGSYFFLIDFGFKMTWNHYNHSVVKYFSIFFTRNFFSILHHPVKNQLRHSRRGCDTLTGCNKGSG